MADLQQPRKHHSGWVEGKNVVCTCGFSKKRGDLQGITVFLTHIEDPLTPFTFRHEKEGD